MNPLVRCAGKTPALALT
ncbi:hypothetical protein [Escherichia coli]|nr:hypothetical protein [Escherichia coli]